MVVAFVPGPGVSSMVSTLFADEAATAPHDLERRAEISTGPMVERIQRLEEEVAELRGTVTRFADIMLGEVKVLRDHQTNLPPLPPELAAAMPMVAPGFAASTGTVVAPLTHQRRPWLLGDLIRDLRTAFQMYLDPRYRLRRGTQLMIPLIVAMFIINCVFFNTVFTLTLISNAMEKLIDVLLGVMLYKVLSREMERYREALVQYAAWRSQHTSASDLVIMSNDPENPPTTHPEMH